MQADAEEVEALTEDLRKVGLSVSSRWPVADPLVHSSANRSLRSRRKAKRRTSACSSSRRSSPRSTRSSRTSSRCTSRSYTRSRRYAVCPDPPSLQPLTCCPSSEAQLDQGAPLGAEHPARVVADGDQVPARKGRRPRPAHGRARGKVALGPRRAQAARGRARGPRARAEEGGGGARPRPARVEPPARGRGGALGPDFRREGSGASGVRGLSVDLNH